MKVNIFLSLILLTALLSCSKENGADNSCAKNMNAIAGAYMVVKLEANAGTSFVDVTSQLDSCQLDDVLTLNTDGRSMYADVGKQCNPTENSTGTWTIDANGKMSIDDNNDNADIASAEISSYDCKTLVLTGYDPGSSNEIRLTMKKQ